MNPLPSVRRAAPADARGIAAVHVASWQVAYRGFFSPDALRGLSIAERQVVWATRLAQSGHDIWVTALDGSVTGFLDACPSRDADRPAPSFAEIAALYVHPSAWGAGCGRALCEAAIAHLRTTPAQTLVVWVLTANTRARHFYERVGFILDEGKKEFTRYGVTLPEVRYRQGLR